MAGVGHYYLCEIKGRKVSRKGCAFCDLVSRKIMFNKKARER